MNPATARLAITVALLGSAWALFREFLRFRQEGAVDTGQLVLALVIPAALYLVVRANRG